MLSLENGPDVETVSNASGYLGDILTYGIMTVPWYIVSEEGSLLLVGFIIESSLEIQRLRALPL
jgi:hypothetical protein